MRNAVFAALLLAACGGDPSAGSRRAGGRDATSGGDGCEAHETSLGSRCWSAAGTRWRIEADGPGGVYRFDIDLLAAGRMRSTDHGAAGPAHDEWFQDGSLFRFFLSDRFVEYRTRITNGTVLVGEAINVRGQRWSWRGDRVFGETACTESEVRLADGCMGVAGTAWELEGRAVQFLHDGVVAFGHEDAVGSWQQTGSSLRFTLSSAGEARAHVAELESSGELSGGYDGAAGTWSATRMHTVPPVMHE